MQENALLIPSHGFSCPSVLHVFSVRKKKDITRLFRLHESGEKSYHKWDLERKCVTVSFSASLLIMMPIKQSRNRGFKHGYIHI